MKNTLLGKVESGTTNQLASTHSLNKKATWNH